MIVCEIEALNIWLDFWGGNSVSDRQSNPSAPSLTEAVAQPENALEPSAQLHVLTQL